ncbi:hypothetical protein BDZ89DRAFT_1124018 [Hymenopellis radicata]|nr:hypothetical protein BDZ89DRAFT_1124018 [Hymenopellis radicata]
MDSDALDDILDNPEALANVVRHVSNKCGEELHTLHALKANRLQIAQATAEAEEKVKAKKANITRLEQEISKLELESDVTLRSGESSSIGRTRRGQRKGLPTKDAQEPETPAKRKGN